MCSSKQVSSLVAFVLLLALSWGSAAQLLSAIEYKLISSSELNSILLSCQQLRTQLALLTSSLQQAKNLRGTLQQDLNLSGKQISDLQQRAASLESSLTLSRQDLAELQNQLTALKASFEQYKNEVQAQQNKSATNEVVAVLVAVGGGVALGIVGTLVVEHTNAGCIIKGMLK